MNYKLIDPENKYLLELKEYGDEILLEMCDMLPEMISKIFIAIEHDLKNNDFYRLFLNIHALRAHFRYFVPYEKSELQFINDAENELQSFTNQAETTIEPEMLNYFIDKIDTVKDIATLLMKEVGVFANEYRKKTSL